MSSTYKYDHLISRHRLRHVLIVLGLSILLIGLPTGFFIWKYHHHSGTVAGAPLSVAQASTNPTYQEISEPTFSFQLPTDWKQTGSQTSPTVHSTSWQATTKGADNRYLTIYTDTIPATYAVNKELPVTVSGNQLSYGALSDNCASFTAGGTLDVAKAESLKPAASVWQGVNFICNLPQVVDNQIGTGSSAGVNTVTVTGPTTGTHSYFFLYIDRNIDPDYTILDNVIQSFAAK